MRFFAAIKSGASVKKVALEFVQVLLKKSWQDNELNLNIACDFVNDLFKAIGLECTITPEQINNDWSYVWPMEQIQIYNFHYIELDFKKLEEFLGEICTLIKIHNEVFINEMQDVANDDLESPVEFLMQLIAVWCSAFKHLLKFEELQTNKRFEEPLARINFPLLLGMHELRKIYRMDLHLLDAICNRLYWSVLQGLFYRQTHDLIFSGLLEVFSKNYDLFYTGSAQTINFFYEAFAVQINTLTPLKLYQTLQDMLQQEVSNNQQNILLNFLIEPYMLRVYFTTFLAKKYKWYDNITNRNIERIRQEALKFLYVLQSKLLSLDCFSREFMETLLNLVFKTDNVTSSLASNLYVTMMQRRFSDQLILKHIMDFYAAHMGEKASRYNDWACQYIVRLYWDLPAFFIKAASSITNLKSYVQALYAGFEFLLNFNNLLELITDSRTKEIIRLISAHILTFVFELKIQNEDSTSKQELQHLLQILPEIFENLHCQKSEGILLKVFNCLPIEELPKSVIDNFTHYALGVFTYTDCPLEYPLLMNIFSIFHKCLMYNKEWHHLEMLSEHLFNKYQAMLKSLQQSAKMPRKSISSTHLENYNHLIKRLNILMKLKYDLWNNSDLNIIHNLSGLFLYNTEIKFLINENKSLTDIYVLEIIMSCLLKLLKQDQSGDTRSCSLLPEVQELFMFLWSTIENIAELTKFPVVKIKTYFCSFVQLIIRSPLKFDNQVYQQLVQILIVVIFQKKFAKQKAANELQQLHPLQTLEYQRLMLRQFTEMHKYQKVQINTNMVWKLCIYYGMSKHDFQADLKNLLITLANYRLNIYKHIISVIIYNLYKQTCTLRHVTIASILKQHKHLIDNDIKVDSSQLLKVHVVLLVLQILTKALSVQRIKTGHNRLEALRHLNIFIEGLDLNQLQAKQLLMQQINEMNQHLMDVEETKLIADFKELLN